MTGLDPRLAVLRKRLEGVRRIVGVTGGKGGTGKSLVSALLALTTSRRGKSSGLLDADLTAPCGHILLGLDSQFPREEFGLEPPEVGGVRLMSLAYFSGNAPTPLRGRDFTNALVELLAITQWGELDLLVVDMPPGLGEAALDLLRWIDRAEYVLVATGSRVVVETVHRTATMLAESRADVLGIIENQRLEATDTVTALCEKTRLAYLGAVPHDAAIEQAIGAPDRLAATSAATAVDEIAREIGL